MKNEMSYTERLLAVAVSPHIHDNISIQKIMRDVIIALIPAVFAAVYFFGFSALKIILICAGSAVLFEYAWQKTLKQPVRINDLSAAAGGLLLALTLPPSLPWWMAVIGAAVTVIFGKQIFGGLGHNPFNPALIGRAFLQISWPQDMTFWTKPFDGVSAATPLAVNKFAAGIGQVNAVSSASIYTLNKFAAGFHPIKYAWLLLGHHAGCLGETSAIALIIGAVFLLLRKNIGLAVPLSFLGVVATGAVFSGQDPVFHIMAGGLVLGAFFMATDPVTSPISNLGKLIFGTGCGILTILIRLKGGYPEGVCFSILIMNMTVPLIDKWTIPRRFGA